MSDQSFVDFSPCREPPSIEAALGTSW